MHGHRRLLGLVGLAFLFSGTAMRAYERSAGTHQVARVSLCEALATIGTGETREIETSGIYMSSFENSFLYDPEQSTCPENVQDSTWVEFSDSAKQYEKTLHRLLKRSGRAFVTFRGDLKGPGPLGPDDLLLPPLVAYGHRLQSKVRYGHLNGYRTQLVVREIVDVKAVPSSFEYPTSGPRDATEPEVVEAQVPKYPLYAKLAGLDGKVRIRFTVEDGRVASVEVLSGDRLLSGESMTFVKTWRFKPGTNATVETTFIYVLERRPAGDEVPRIELKLPMFVKVTAARNDW